MEWTESLKRAINYMEQHLLEDISADDAAEVVHMSPFYFQKGFSIMTDFSVGEYIRNRRLYLAALDLTSDRGKVIDLAYKYGYDTPESFTKAFSRFHGVSPMQLKGDSKKIKVFLPLTISVTIKGGNAMDYKVERKEAMKMVGFSKAISYEHSYKEIPEFWMSYHEESSEDGKVCDKDVEKGKVSPPPCGQGNVMVGEYALCIPEAGDKKYFRYMIAGEFNGEEVPKGMEVYELPATEWAVFNCIGPLPGALQSVNTQIFREWLPVNPEFELAGGVTVEWYSYADTRAADYKSAIWVPVRRK